MDRRLIRYYDRELRHLQTVGKEFAREFPKIASRLAIEDFPCVDPYVERLLEGFAFLAGRVQLKLDAEFPRFTQNLLEVVYPHYLAPTPSMCIVQFNHNQAEAGLAEGFTIPRNSVLRSQPVRESTVCEYRTAQPVNLWPMVVAEARYFTRDVGTLDLGKAWGDGPDAAPRHIFGPPATIKAAIRIRLRATAGVAFSKMNVDDLVFYLRGSDATPFRIYEALFAHARGVLVRPVPAGRTSGAWQEHMGQTEAGEKPIGFSRVGYAAGEALLPYDERGFQGYRLLHEYFAFPQRYLFVKLGNLRKAMAKCDGGHLDIIIPLSQENPDLEGALDAENFVMHCAPAVNIFPKRADRIFVSESANEFQIIPDRTKPLDFEVYRVNRVTGFGASADERVFRPFYSATDGDDQYGGSAAFFATHRVPRALSEREKRMGVRSGYTGSEVYVSLVDAHAAPFSSDIRQLAVETLCSNRDLPLQMPVGKFKSDFSLDQGAPCESVRVVAGPTPPRASHAEGDASWRLISHLTLNYLSITDEDIDKDGVVSAEERQGAGALRELLKLYGDIGDSAIRQQIDGLRTVHTRPITRRTPTPGVVAFARGLEVTVELEESFFEGTGIFLLGAVLDQFFARYVSMNSFTETVVRSQERGEVMRWSARVGQRPIM